MPTSLYDNWLLVAFKLSGDGVFSDGKNTKVCVGLRMIASIEGDPPPAGFSANVTIFGMNESDMQLIASIKRNLSGSTKMQIYASDTRNEPAAVFAGWIFDARVNYNDMPNVSIDITAFSSGALKSIYYPPISYKEPVKVQNILEGHAQFAGLTFENDGVDKTFTSCYLYGSVGSNIDAICRDANIRYAIENDKLAIWDKQRDLPVPTISVETGLVGYPTAGINGIFFTCLYNPAIRFGGQVRLETSVAQCTGTFFVMTVTHNLSSQLPSGAWFSVVQCFYDSSVLNEGVL